MIRAVLSVALLTTACAADACSRQGGAPTLEESFSSATEVFVAHLIKVIEKDIPPSWGDADKSSKILEASYSLTETIRGDPPSSGKLYDLVFGIGNCSIGLMVGWDYVVFVRPNEELPKIRFVGMLSGTFPLNGKDANQDLARVRTLAQKSSNSGKKQ